MVTKGYHHAYETHYHIVFPVKYRKALLRREVVDYLKEIFDNIEDRHDIKFEEVGYDLDHIHILCSFPPTKSGGDVVRIIKSLTAREIFKKFPDIKKDLWGGNFWTAGYYIATVSEHSNWKVVENYIKKQGKGNTEGLKQLTLI